MHQAVAGEIVFNRLIERLMVTVVEHAGAVRGLVLLPQDGEMQVVAEAVTEPQFGHQCICGTKRHTAGELPQSVLNYVMCARKTIVIVDDAMTSRVHSADEYVRRVRPQGHPVSSLGQAETAGRRSVPGEHAFVAAFSPPSGCPC
jgi:hypothetical protein